MAMVKAAILILAVSLTLILCQGTFARGVGQAAEQKMQDSISVAEEVGVAGDESVRNRRGTTKKPPPVRDHFAKT